MRTRKEIREEWRGEFVSFEGIEGYRPSGRHIEGLLLEVLLDIRDLVKKKK